MSLPLDGENLVGTTIQMKVSRSGNSYGNQLVDRILFLDFCHWPDSKAVAEVNSRLFIPNQRLETDRRTRSLGSLATAHPPTR